MTVVAVMTVVNNHMHLEIFDSKAAKVVVVDVGLRSDSDFVTVIAEDSACGEMMADSFVFDLGVVEELALSFDWYQYYRTLVTAELVSS